MIRTTNASVNRLSTPTEPLLSVGPTEHEQDMERLLDRIMLRPLEGCQRRLAGQYHNACLVIILKQNHDL